MPPNRSREIQKVQIVRTVIIWKLETAGTLLGVVVGTIELMRVMERETRTALSARLLTATRARLKSRFTRNLNQLVAARGSAPAVTGGARDRALVSGTREKPFGSKSEITARKRQSTCPQKQPSLVISSRRSPFKPNAAQHLPCLMGLY